MTGDRATVPRPPVQQPLLRRVGWHLSRVRGTVDRRFFAVRTVVEVNNPRHRDHFLRAKADEILITSTLASHLLARSALYPGLTGIITDIVSGGEGSELYRVALPDEYLGFTIDEVSARLRSDNRATLLSVNRGGRAFVNPPTDFRLAHGDDAVVVAESLGQLAPLELRDARSAELEAAPEGAAAAERAGARSFGGSRRGMGLGCQACDGLLTATATVSRERGVAAGKSRSSAAEAVIRRQIRPRAAPLDGTPDLVSPWLSSATNARGASREQRPDSDRIATG